VHEHHVSQRAAHAPPGQAIVADVGDTVLVEDVLADFENEFPVLESNLNQIHKYIYSQNAICNFGIAKEIENYATKHLEDLVKKININLVSKDKLSNLNTDFFKFPDKSLNLFYNSNSDTNFNILGLKYSNLNSEDKSVIKILEPYMFQYLWENIRVKNGAYGAFWTLNKNYEYGVFGSYSDPKLNETYKTYLNTKKKYDISKLDINRIYRYLEKYTKENASETEDITSDDEIEES
jgi:Zn-dependent M16 (insulinase) family peptidase